MRTAVLFSCLTASPILVRASAEESPNASIAADEKDPYEQVDFRDLMKKLFKRDSDGKEPEKKKKTSIFLIPVVGANPSIGTSFGAAFSAVGYRESEEENVSTMLVSLTYTSKSFLVFSARSDLTLKEHWHVLGDWRYYDYRERTYGFGSDTSEEVYADFDYKWIRFREAVLYPVFDNLEVGVDYNLDMHLDIQTAAETADEILNVIPESGDTVSSGIGPVFVYDSTDNRINASRGLYFDGKYRFYQEWLGSDEDWQLLELEARSYYRFHSRRSQVLAFWGLTQMVTSGTAPYFDHPANAWDTYGRTTRGYTAGRFRGTGWLYGEVEYRTDLTRNGFVGAVAFANTSSFRTDDGEGFGDPVFGGGFGFRLKVDKRTGSNIAIDVGLGQEGSRAVYLAFNEAF